MCLHLKLRVVRKASLINQDPSPRGGRRAMQSPKTTLQRQGTASTKVLRWCVSMCEAERGWGRGSMWGWKHTYFEGDLVMTNI